MTMRALFILAALFCISFGAPPDPVVPTINLSLSAPSSPQQLVNSLNVLIFLTVLTLAPSLVL